MSSKETWLNTSSIALAKSGYVLASIARRIDLIFEKQFSIGEKSGA
jgi:hypothetical protein